MLDVRLDLLHMLDSDAMTFTSCRKVVDVELYLGEFGTTEKLEETIAPRNYPQAAASLRRMGRFINNLPDLAKEEGEVGDRARKIRQLPVGGLVITIREKVTDPESPTGEKLVPAIVYYIPIKDGLMYNYDRKYHSIMSTNIA